MMMIILFLVGTNNRQRKSLDIPKKIKVLTHLLTHLPTVSDKLKPQLLDLEG